MSQYTSTSGTILQIQWQNSAPAQSGCGLMLTLQTMDQGIVNIHVDGSTYIPDNHPLKTGEQITCFYSLLAPVPLIYPPQYHGVVVVPTPAGTYAALDTFTRLPSGNQLTNSDDTLRLNISNTTKKLSPTASPLAVFCPERCFLSFTLPLPEASLPKPPRNGLSYSAEPNKSFSITFL